MIDCTSCRQDSVDECSLVCRCRCHAIETLESLRAELAAEWRENLERAALEKP